MAETKKLTKEEQELYEKAEVEADKMKTLFIFAMHMDVEMLKSTRTHLKESISSYEAIGIMDGSAYTIKLEQYRAKLARLDIIIRFVEVLRDTNEILEKDPNEKFDISGMLGL